MNDVGASEERLHRAQDLLREFVYGARAVQATGVALASPDAGRLDAPSRPGGCGLGDDAPFAAELSPRGRALLDELFPGGPDEVARERLVAVAREWVDRQDAFDRRRNHFLRDFRGEHGFDRGAWDAATLGTYEAGLDRLHTEEDAERRLAALRLLGA